MATVSGKIYQVKDGTTNLFPRTVIEAVYGLDKTIADVETWVGNSFVKYSHGIYNPASAVDLNDQYVAENTIQQISWNFSTYSNVSNRPYSSASAASVLVLPNAWGGLQFYTDYNSNTYYIRNRYSTTGWKSWVQLYHTGNFNPANYLTTSAAAGTYLPLSGGQMTGPLKWKDSTALPENTSAVYFLTIDAFASGGTTKWASADTVKTSLGLANYLPLAAQGVTVYRTTSGQIVDFNNSKGANEEAFFTISSNGTRRNAVGWNTTHGTYIYNYASAKYLGIKPDGTPHYQGYTLWHSGNSNLYTVNWVAAVMEASTRVQVTGGSDAKIILDNTDSETNFQYISFRQNGTQYGRLGTFGSTDLAWNGMNIYHTGNANKYDTTWTAKALYLPVNQGINFQGAEYSALYQDGNFATYVGAPTTNTIIRSSGSLTHLQGSTNYTIYDSGNLNKSKIIDIMGTFPEAYLWWGGRNLTAGSHSPIDAALCDSLGANRFAFANPAGIGVFYSRDSGATWTDYEADSGAKLNLTAKGTAWLAVGKAGASSPATTAYRLKIVMYANNCGIYSQLNKFIIGTTTNGSGGCWCTLRGQTKANYDAGNDTWTTFAEKASLTGWPGKNVINTTTFTYGSGDSHFLRLEFTFGFDSGTPTSTYYGLAIQGIYAYGGVGWTEPSNMAYTGHLYSWDYNQSAYFPRDIHPSISGSSLGTSSNRWALNATSGSFSGNISTSGTITATGQLTASAVNATYIKNDNYYIGDAINGLGSGYSGALIYTYGNKPIHFYTNSQPRVYIGGDGLVGIGTQTPSSPLHVNGVIRSYNSSNSYGIAVGDGSNSIEGLYGSGYGTMHINYFSNGGVSICTGGGCLTVGGAVQTAYKFKVNGTQYLAGFLKIAPSTGGNWNEGIRLYPASNWTTIILGGNDLTADTGTSANSWSIHNNNGIFCIAKNGSSPTTAKPGLFNSSNKWSFTGGNVGIGILAPAYTLDVVGTIHSTVGIFSDGYVSALGTASSSDAKLKDDITTISYDKAKEVLSALNPREWTWNSLTLKKGERGAGMVAQEVEPILPDTVKEIGGNLTLEYNTLFAYGLAMTKYLVPAVESLEERVARLERENEELKRQLTN